QICADGDIHERKIFLRPREIELHSRGFIHTDRANIANDPDDLVRYSKAANEQSLADWIFTGINLFRAGMADQTDFLRVGGVMLVKLTAGQQWNSPSFQICRRDVVARPISTLFDWWNIAILARVESTVTAVQRNVATDGRALEARHVLQRVEKLLGETMARHVVGILRRRERDSASPKFLRLEAEVLLTQSNETGDEQCRAGQ